MSPRVDGVDTVLAEEAGTAPASDEWDDVRLEQVEERGAEAGGPSG